MKSITRLEGCHGYNWTVLWLWTWTRIGHEAGKGGRDQ